MEIIATISLKSYPPEKTREIIDAGADILRFNFAHGTPEENVEKVRTARRLIAESGRQVRILADLPGAKIRLGDFPEKILDLGMGEEVLFRSGSESPSCKDYVPVNLSGFARGLSVGQVFPVGDGEVAFEITQIVSENEVRAKCLANGQLKSYKGIHLGARIDELDHCNEETLRQMDVLGEIKPEMVAFSFVRSGSELRRCKNALADRLTSDWRPSIVSKVETQQGVENIREIIDGSDWVLIARGDLGLNVPIEKFALAQKKITALTRAAGKRVIVSTQLLESTINTYVPQRSDIMDLSNAIFDGAHAIMLCAETGMNDHPGRSVSIAKRIIDALT